MKSLTFTENGWFDNQSKTVSSMESTRKAPSDTEITQAIEILKAVFEQSGWVTKEERVWISCTIQTLDSLTHYPVIGARDRALFRFQKDRQPIAIM